MNVGVWLIVVLYNQGFVKAFAIKSFWLPELKSNFSNRVFAKYVDNLSNIPIDLLDGNVFRIDLKSSSPEEIVFVFDVAEKRLDNSDKSKRIKSLLFSNISYNQWNALHTNNFRDFTIQAYFPHIDKQVMYRIYFCSRLFCRTITISTHTHAYGCSFLK